MREMRLLAALAVSLGATTLAHADSYVFGGVAGAGAWEWTGAGMDELRAAIANPAKFGPGGTVPHAATTVVLPGIAPGTLATIDCFVSPAVADSTLSPTELGSIVAWFMAGGDLLLLDDRDDFDAIGEALGFPTLAGPGFGSGIFVASAVGSGPLVNGPFGAVGTLNQAYLVGHLEQAGVVATGGIVAATNAAGVAVAHWDRGAFGPSSGKLVIVVDVDSLADNNGYPGMADYGLTNANAAFALNTVAYFLTPTSCPADLDGDGQIGPADLAILLGAWGGATPADLDGDGHVGAADLAILLGAWGPC